MKFVNKYFLHRSNCRIIRLRDNLYEKYLDSLPMEKVEKIIISTYENERLTEERKEEKIDDLLYYRCRRLTREFEWSAENIKALEETNEMLMEECLAAASHLKEHVEELELKKPKGEIMYTDYEAKVEILSFKSEPSDEDDDYDEDDYYRYTHIEDVLISSVNKYYKMYGVHDFSYFLSQEDRMSGKAPRHTGLERGAVLWLNSDLETDNWNEHLPEEYTSGMHLCYAFHNLFDHCRFSPQDIINIRDMHHILTIRT